MLRLAALLGAGELAVHQLRYLLGYGGDASTVLTARGHGYLGPLAAVVAGIVVLALAELLARALRRPARPVPSLRALWAGATVAIALLYSTQELIEGSSPASHGGWLALPLAALAGLAIAAIMRLSARAEVAARRPWRAPGLIAVRLDSVWAVASPPWSPAHMPPARGPPRSAL